MKTSEFEKLYEEDGPMIQTQMTQLFEWLKSHADLILIDLSKIMKSTTIKFDKININIYPIILTTLPQDIIEKCFKTVLDNVLEDLEHIEEQSSAITQLSRYTTINSVNEIIKRIVDRIIDNDSFSVNSKMISLYSSLITKILWYI